MLGPCARLLLAAVLGSAVVPGSLTAQAGVQGIVTDAATGTPLEFANVVLEASGVDRYADGTDRNGYYQIGGIEAGAYILRVERLGYALHEEPLTFFGRETPTVSIRLSPEPVTLEEVMVGRGNGGAVRRELGRQRVTPIDLARIPVPAGSGDLASYLQTLPGVVTTGDRGGQLFVRGGTHTGNLSLIDGLPIFQPFHIVGFFSAFPENLVANADFYGGGFGPRYSGRTSAVLDVQMRDGDRTQYRGSGSVSPFLAEMVVEGPADRAGRWSWLASARRSLIEETSPSVLGRPEPLRFESQFLKLSFLGDDNARCSAMALRTADRGRMDPEDLVSQVSWENVVYGGRCVVPHEGSHRLIEADIGVSRVRSSAVVREASGFFSDLERFQLEVITTDLARGIPYEFGVSVSLDETQYDLAELFSQLRSKDFLWVWKSYVEADINLGERIRMRPGAVLHITRPTRGIEPRLRVSWRPWGREEEELSAAIGLYRQTITGISDSRDAGSVFVAWRPTPGNRPMEALHVLLGWQQTLSPGLHGSIETFYKRLRQIPVPVWNTTAEFDTQLALAKGRVFGADLRIEYARPPFYGFAGYGWSWTEYEAAQDHFSVWFGEPVQRYHPPHDRRHQVNAMLRADLGPLEAAIRWQLGTGLPFTRPLGFDEAFDFRRTIEDVHTTHGRTRSLLEKPYQGKLPAFHRLDISVAGTIGLPFGDVEVQAGAVNVYDRRNLFYYDLYTQRRLDQLPIAPYLSLRLEVP